MLFSKKNKKSKKLEISYKMSSGIPFKWEYEIIDETIVEFVKKEVKGEKTKRPICGGPITIYYYFKGLKEGKTKIVFKLVNLTNNSLEKEEEYNISVDEKLNIALIRS